MQEILAPAPPERSWLGADLLYEELKENSLLTCF